MYKLKKRSNDDIQVFLLTVGYSLLHQLCSNNFPFYFFYKSFPKKKRRSLKGSVTRDFIFILNFPVLNEWRAECGPELGQKKLCACFAT
jgi:hypothetical protein